MVLDDASSEIYYAQLVEQESTRTVLAALREVVEQQGIFCALYSDRASHFFLTRKAGEPVDRQRLTQVGRALRELGIQMIPAYSPQARGRSERNFGTWQGRLPQELRLRGIITLEAANRFLREGLYRGVQPALCRAGHPTRQRLFAVSQAGVRPNLLDPAPADSESGQYGQSGEPPPPDRENSLARDSGGLPGDRL